MTITVLLTNDDGPPDPHESPYILGLYQQLTRDLGWNVKVVIPSAQKSWIGKAYQIKQKTRGWYYYPRHDGQSEISEHPRQLKDGELAEWIILDGTPATCANIALHNLYPGLIDLVISGPNLGRNTSAAFALSSGTIGAALSSSLSKMRSIAVSYGTMTEPVSIDHHHPAHALCCHIVRYLWNNWGKDDGGLRDGEIDLYSVNIPMIQGLLSEEGLDVCWTHLWKNSYGRLFKDIAHSGAADTVTTVIAARPDATDEGILDKPQNLLFKFSPDFSPIIAPDPSNIPVGSDAWALQNGYACITPLCASFAQPPAVDRTDGQILRIKL